MTYASLEDFVTEPNVMGRVLWTKKTHEGSRRQVTTCAYDANERLITRELIDDDGTDALTTMLEWDDLGRPTKGLMLPNPASSIARTFPSRSPTTT